ncbi:pentatricopeptide repeat-containing protein At1g74600, chloroplastic [Amborella trichopoda]|uniref:Pentacotripeptide-repeat region of PRORP domain-containing protein n=1 Tax=Amborella trichopoda TaxID=13333 RepID=W1NF71_AMBTC|nr:pentatricopeptide repeat-containing protein At1g74600, chloroplastic [Amborella trichopoda]ERM94457.1 hypothetical protein AMTR_s00010p00260120 [Amborella trichopoda]|eukprot:XP_006827220.1 pentatricopeptide repeat-containing protein At1g74600, chloroplastic [Amborella trichopoda]
MMLNSPLNKGFKVIAPHLFDEISSRNFVSSKISPFCKSSGLEDSWRPFYQMVGLGFKPNQFIYGSLLSACAASQAVKPGLQAYSHAIKTGFSSDDYVCTGMIGLFSKCHCFNEALRVFNGANRENVISWNTTIAGGVRNADYKLALELFLRMLDGFSAPSSFTLSSVLGACSGLKALVFGQGIHGWVVKSGVEGDVFVGTALVDMYSKCGKMEDAVKAFERIPDQNEVCCTAIISGFVQSDHPVSALRFFIDKRKTGVDFNQFTITSVLCACAQVAWFKEASQVHCLTVKTGFFEDCAVQNALINTYSKCGSIDFAERVFEGMGGEKNSVSWASMMTCYAQNHMGGKSIKLFQRMLNEGLKPECFACSSVLSIIGLLDMGKQIHCFAIKAGLDMDISVGSAIFTMYSKCGCLDDSYKVFALIPKKDAVSWTSMIAGFSEYGQPMNAFQVFQDMLMAELKPDQVTLAAVLSACTACKSMKRGKEVHGYAIVSGVGSETLFGGALVTLYSKCGALVLAQRAFDSMHERDLVAWSSLISGYAQNDMAMEVMAQFRDMRISDLDMDGFTISSILRLSGSSVKLELGIEIHALSVKSGLDLDHSVSSSLITMYSKCGSLYDSSIVFDSIMQPCLISWTAIIVAYAQHGQANEALKLFEKMKREGVEPDSVTFVGVLTACSHNGLVEKGFSYLNSMVRDYGLKPGTQHYACIVDLLGRSGKLEEAWRFIESMPIEPDALIWGALLGGCRVHGHEELGKLAAQKLLELEPRDSGAYVCLSNIYAEAGCWEEVREIRSLMREMGVNKEPGWSSM